MLFIIVHQLAAGLHLGPVAAVNHKGTIVLDEDSQLDFLRRQVLTARNVKAHPLTDFWYGGLNYQIEHHLFPNMPRNKLKESHQLSGRARQIWTGDLVMNEASNAIPIVTPGTLPTAQAAARRANSAPTARLANEYAELRQMVKEQGLLDRQPVYYAFKITFTLALFAASIAFLLFVNNPPFQLLNAAFLAMVFQQLSEIGHDMGHQQISHTRWKNVFFGLLLGDLVLGMSRDWWIGKHNRHHSNPNQLDTDPDIDISIIAFTEEQALAKRGLARLIVKYQAFWLFPLMPLQSIALYNNSVTFVWRKESKHNTAEALLLALHWVLYLGLVFSRLSPGWGLLFIAIHQALYGSFLVSIFASNHKGMPILDKDTRDSFLRRQIVTARNLYPNPVLDFWYGGLNYQIEHHLFPDMPRNNLRAARTVVKAFCEERGIPYYETDFLESWREILQYLHEIGAPLRAEKNSTLPSTPMSEG
jgi:fatty acid desaturase